MGTTARFRHAATIAIVAGVGGAAAVATFLHDSTVPEATWQSVHSLPQRPSDQPVMAAVSPTQDGRVAAVAAAPRPDPEPLAPTAAAVSAASAAARMGNPVPAPTPTDSPAPARAVAPDFSPVQPLEETGRAGPIAKSLPNPTEAAPTAKRKSSSEPKAASAAKSARKEERASRSTKQALTDKSKPRHARERPAPFPIREFFAFRR